MDRSDRRYAHLMAHLAKFEEDVDFINHVNRGLEKRPEFEPNFSASYLGQLKAQERGIGHQTARKLEAGLGLSPGSFDAPLPAEIERVMRANGQDAEFEAMALLLEAGQDEAAIKVIAERVSLKDAATFARVFLDRVVAEL